MTVQLSRRTVLRATAAGGLVTAAAPAAPLIRTPRVVGELEDKIRQDMERFGVPGVGLGLWYRGREYVRGFGVARAGTSSAVDGDTLFRTGSTGKTFTGAAVMRLAETGRLDLDRTVRSYLPGFRVADPGASARVTVRQVLGHSAGWLGDFFLDTGSGDDALARFVDGMRRLPQLSPPGRVFAYNNAALSLAGRLIEVAAGRPYEDVVQTALLDPLRMTRSGFFLDRLPGAQTAVPHVIDPATGELVALPEAFEMPRSLHPAGGLIASARDQLRWARFHLGDGAQVLSRRSLRAMRSRPGPGGTLFVEVDGAGVTWMIRPTAEGPKVVQHGGNWPGQHSGFLMVPERDFAITVLTNADTGPALLSEMFTGDWALRRFAGARNLPAVPQRLSAAQLAPYAGSYTGEQIGPDGATVTIAFDLVAADGQLSLRVDGEEGQRFAFYRKDYVLGLLPDGRTPTLDRSNFVRGADGTVRWLRLGGRLYRRGAPASRRAAPHTPHHRRALLS